MILKELNICLYFILISILFSVIKNFTIERNIDKENPLVQDPKIETAERSKRQKKKLS